MISPFPYKIDAPFGWWTPASGLTVCGGKNWDDDRVTFNKLDFGGTCLAGKGVERDLIYGNIATDETSSSYLSLSVYVP